MRQRRVVETMPAGDPRRRGWLLILALAALTWMSRLSQAQSTGHHVHPPMSDQGLVVRVQLSGDHDTGSVEIPLELPSTLAACDVDKSVTLPGGSGSLRVLRYLPQAFLHQEAEVVENGRPALELSVEGPTQSYRRWLTADDPDRNRLISFIGTWRFMSVPDGAQRDQLFQQFETEFTRDPRLVVSRVDGTSPRSLPLSLGSTQRVEDCDAAVRVIRFYPDYAMDREKNEAVNRSEVRRNPAALVEVSWKERTEQRWLFAKFPAFREKDADPLPIRMTLDCPSATSGETPDFALVAVAGGALEVWTRRAGQTESAVASTREQRPIAGTQYQFQVVRFVPSAKLTEEYRPAEGGKGTAAVKVQAADATGSPSDVWVALGESRSIPSAAGPLTVSFATREAHKSGGHP